jgi:hypothetical protein
MVKKRNHEKTIQQVGELLNVSDEMAELIMTAQEMSGLFGSIDAIISLGGVVKPAQAGMPYIE